ncbi:hypothetical protein [Mycobacteroides abscessus]|uniref:hypothetical protein n=1 Tax=Mycobacteroides abscessus TaxID=36809 RepID=UPI001F3AE917|nr:hypothetical protein [Mycobacteroides abscessus]
MSRRRPDVDYSLEADIMHVAQVAFGMVSKIREDDLQTVFDQLQVLAELHPSKYAQITMALAAFVNPEEGTATLLERAERIADSRAMRRLSVLAS